MRQNLTGSSTAYAYDPNGNLTNDYYKGLQNSYNVLNRTDNTTITAGTGQHINYIYDAGGALIRKLAYNGGMLQTQTDYVGGFVFVNGALSYFPMPEGRVTNNSGTLTQEYIITDQQGNARISFQDNGSGTAVVKQENSYYGFGLQLLNSPVSPPAVPNKQLYNGGSEWQNDYSNQPDYYQTFYRNYDAATGRFVGQDPMPESAASMSTYHYAGDNPIMMNDPTGNHAAPVGRTTNLLWAQEVQDPNFQWFASNSDAEMSQWVSSLGASGAGGSGGFAPGDLQGNDPFFTSAEAENVASINQYDAAFAASTNIFDAGTSGFDVSTGVADAQATLTALNNADKTNSGVDIFINADGDMSSVKTGTSRSYLNTQNQNLSWNFGAAQQGGTGVINIYRFAETNNSTISAFVTGSGLTGYILEPAGPSTTTPNQDKRIPAGTYNLTPHVNTSLHSEWELYNDAVSTDRGILIHIGNYPSDTEGCLLIGSSYSTDFVGGSGPALQQLNNYINSFNGNVKVNIHDPVKAPVPFF